jgi:hypothetical protein
MPKTLMHNSHHSPYTLKPYFTSNVTITKKLFATSPSNVYLNSSTTNDVSSYVYHQHHIVVELFYLHNLGVRGLNNDL